MRLFDRAVPRGGNCGILCLGLLWVCLAGGLAACGGAGAPETPAVSAPASGQTAQPEQEPLTEEEQLIAAQLERIDLEEKTRSFVEELQGYLHETEYREIRVGDPIVMDGAVLLPLQVTALPMGAQAGADAYHIVEVAFRLNNFDQYIIYDGQDLRPLHFGPRAFGCATSPDGQWRMETVVREDLVTRLLAYPFDDTPVWVGDAFSGMATRFFWTWDSRYVGIESDGAASLFRLEDFSVTPLPGVDYFLEQEIPEELYVHYDEGLKPLSFEGARGPFPPDARVSDFAVFRDIPGQETLTVECGRYTDEIAPYFIYEYHIGTGEVTLLEFGFVQGY